MNQTIKDKKIRTVDHTGEIINGYVVLFPLKQRAKNRLALWRIRCTSCQHERIIRSDHLTARQLPVCACKKAAARNRKEQSV